MDPHLEYNSRLTQDRNKAGTPTSSHPVIAHSAILHRPTLHDMKACSQSKGEEGILFFSLNYLDILVSCYEIKNQLILFFTTPQNRGLLLWGRAVEGARESSAR